MSKGIRSFPKEQQQQVAHRRTAGHGEKGKQPKGLGYWGATDFLKRKHG